MTALLGAMPMVVNAGPNAVVDPEGYTTWSWEYVEGETGEFSNLEDMVELTSVEMNGFYTPHCLRNLWNTAPVQDIMGSGSLITKITFVTEENPFNEELTSRGVLFRLHFDGIETTEFSPHWNDSNAYCEMADAAYISKFFGVIGSFPLVTPVLPPLFQE